MKRQSSLDILRIIATFNVIWIHCTIFYKYHYVKHLPPGLLISNIFSKTCNFLFMLISGYIGLSIKFKLSNILNLIIETIIYSLSVVFIQCFFFNLINYSSINWLIILTPLAHNKYWYPVPFLFAQLLFFFISPSIRQTPINKYIKFCSILVFILFTQKYHLYSVGLDSTRYNITPFLITFFICPLIQYWKDELGKYAIQLFLLGILYNFIIHNYEFLISNSIFKIFFDTNLFEMPSLLLSITMLNIAINLKKDIHFSKLIQKIAETSYGIYICGIGTHVNFCWRIRANYEKNLILFSKITFLLSIKTFFCLFFIVYTENKLSQLIIYRRSFYSKIKNLIDK